MRNIILILTMMALSVSPAMAGSSGGATSGGGGGAAGSILTYLTAGDADLDVSANSGDLYITATTALTAARVITFPPATSTETRTIYVVTGNIGSDFDLTAESDAQVWKHFSDQQTSVFRVVDIGGGNYGWLPATTISDGATTPTAPSVTVIPMTDVDFTLADGSDDVLLDGSSVGGGVALSADRTITLPDATTATARNVFIRVGDASGDFVMNVNDQYGFEALVRPHSWALFRIYDTGSDKFWFPVIRTLDAP
jgi:hypothetical protein